MQVLRKDPAVPWAPNYSRCLRFDVVCTFVCLPDRQRCDVNQGTLAGAMEGLCLAMPPTAVLCCTVLLLEQYSTKKPRRAAQRPVNPSDGLMASASGLKRKATAILQVPSRWAAKDEGREGSVHSLQWMYKSTSLSIAARGRLVLIIANFGRRNVGSLFIGHTPVLCCFREARRRLLEDYFFRKCSCILLTVCIPRPLTLDMLAHHFIIIARHSPLQAAAWSAFLGLVADTSAAFHLSISMTFVSIS